MTTLKVYYHTMRISMAWGTKYITSQHKLLLNFRKGNIDGGINLGSFLAEIQNMDSSNSASISVRIVHCT